MDTTPSYEIKPKELEKWLSDFRAVAYDEISGEIFGWGFKLKTGDFKRLNLTNFIQIVDFQLKI